MRKLVPKMRIALLRRTITSTVFKSSGLIARIGICEKSYEQRFKNRFVLRAQLGFKKYLRLGEFEKEGVFIVTI